MGAIISRYWTLAFAGVTSKSGVIPAKAGIQDLKDVQTNMARLIFQRSQLGLQNNILSTIRLGVKQLKDRISKPFFTPRSEPSTPNLFF